MPIMLKGCLVFLALSIPALILGLDCDLKGKCVNSSLVGLESVQNENECLKKCHDNGSCKWFTYFSGDRQCLEFSNCNSLDASCQDCVTGQSECYDSGSSNCTQEVNGCCQGTSLDYFPNTDDLGACRQKCQEYPDGLCHWYSYQLDLRLCVLLKDCGAVNNQDEDVCTSGTVDDCDDDECDSIDGCCQGNVLDFEKAQSVAECRAKCQNLTNCAWFSYNLQGQICLLMSSCDSLSNQDAGVCTSQAMTCSNNTTPEVDAVVLVALGSNDNGATKSVEILDFEKGRVCSQSEATVSAIGAVGFLKDASSAVFCGGVGQEKRCQVLRGDNSWTVASSMQRSRSYASMSEFDQGVLVTGGLGNGIEASMEIFDGAQWTLLKSELPELENLR